jgi:hypothetical protein
VYSDPRSTRRRLLANMNSLRVGFSNSVDLPKGSWLLIDDEPVKHPKGRMFDPMKHCFNPLKGIDYKRARELTDLPSGGQTRLRCETANARFFML